MNHKKILIALSLICVSVWATINHLYQSPENVKELIDLPINDKQEAQKLAQVDSPKSTDQSLKSVLKAKQKSKASCPNTNKSVAIPVDFKEKPSTRPKDSRNITIVNNISQDDLTYKKHWSGYHTPTSFHIKINGEEFMKHPRKKIQTHMRGKGRTTTSTSAQHPTKITVVNNEVDIEVFYEFKVMGVSRRKEMKRFKTKIPEGTQTVAAQFTWETDSKVSLMPVKGS